MDVLYNGYPAILIIRGGRNTKDFNTLKDESLFRPTGCEVFVPIQFVENGPVREVPIKFVCIPQTQEAQPESVLAAASV